jgi:hypothetical protein
VLSGDGVLDLDEFVDLVATSAVLRPAFGHILAAAKAKREQDEYERLSSIFRNPNELSSPSGRRRRPCLFDLRAAHELAMPWESLPVTTAPLSPDKSQIRKVVPGSRD